MNKIATVLVLLFLLVFSSGCQPQNSSQNAAPKDEPTEKVAEVPVDNSDEKPATREGYVLLRATLLDDPGPACKYLNALTVKVEKVISQSGNIKEGDTIWVMYHSDHVCPNNRNIPTGDKQMSSVFPGTLVEIYGATELEDCTGWHVDICHPEDAYLTILSE